MGRGIDRIDAQMILLVIIWGSAFPGIKVLGEALSPTQMTWYRYALFPLLYGAWLFARRRETMRTMPGRDWLRMAVLGAIGVLGYHLTLNWGLDESHSGAITAATGAILIATTPLFTLLLSAATRAEKLRAGSLVGSLVAFVGVAVVVIWGRGEAEVSVARTALIVLVAPLSWAIYTVGTKPLIARYGGLYVTGITMSLATLMLAPWGISYGIEPLRDLTGLQWFWLFFLAILSTALGYAIWNHALRVRSASQVSAFVYFNPVVATIVGYIFLGEKVTGWFLLGGALVMLGVIQVNRVRLSDARPPTAATGEATPIAVPPADTAAAPISVTSDNGGVAGDRADGEGNRASDGEPVAKS